MVSYTIYHHLPVVKRGSSNPSMNQPTNGKRTSMVWESLSGWWLSHPSEKFGFVSWDDDIPNIWKNKIPVPNHQPVIATWVALLKWIWMVTGIECTMRSVDEKFVYPLVICYIAIENGP